ncbi:MAG: pitrilysin family protein, partial [Dehalococcoidia bacterium]
MNAGLPPSAAPADPLLDSRVLPNGLRVLTSAMPHTRSATISFYFGAGSRYEVADYAGVSHLVEHCCFKGSRRWPTAKQISETIEGVGGVLNAGTDREFTVYYAKVPRDHLKLALEVVTDMVLHPVFDATELEKERKVILEELATVEDNPGQLAEVQLDALLWPDQALGRDVAGTPASVRAIPREYAMHYRSDQYTPANALISVAGAVEPDEVAADIEALSADWEYGAPGPWAPVEPLAPDHRRVHVHAKSTEQAHLMLGLPGLAADHPDRYALTLLAGVLGEGMSSRLFVSLREEMGLAYDVHAYAANLRDTGAFSIYLGVDPDNARRALEAALAEVGRLREGVPAAELTKVREYIKGRMLLSMEDTRAVSSWYGGQALLLNRARSVEAVVADIEAVTQEDLIRVAGEALRDENLHLAIVGPFETEEPFREALHL